MKAPKIKNYPTHLCIIPDGCRRWAIKKKIGTIEGHKKGIEVLENLGRWSIGNTPIKYYTVYGLSYENLQRPAVVLNYLYDLYSEHFLKLAEDKDIHKNKVSIDIVGRADLLPRKLLNAIKVAQDSTSMYEKKFFRIALAYSGRQEIVDSAKKITNDGGEITEEKISRNLYSNAPDPDLLVRTAEKRISNFMLWGSAYMELYFIDKYWPDVTLRDYINALKDFDKRKRRFGKYGG
ncbi:TPA: di-trans,poly-cis-decaprenylcistransferase [archaeon]|uniref:Tritrans,polycis-undecaprenyl-diphosphate synthase (geranylgeranyl-diphosphate specific) n=1 Tax=Candidatus Naiadarchaeum limnaeum TaxID=2756139 RepID=A0A832XJ42_9ARCH|nr:di-trans,poly-cis-decaprenylcistransferase [Candidatus Naiadarchaeales archaeon SRR2090153.bin1042]HIK00067.1 di-trans,poly-cis-decaprenylcistransferase [Candidatus Naiadarchaeum limnaeum]